MPRTPDPDRFVHLIAHGASLMVPIIPSAGADKGGIVTLNTAARLHLSELKRTLHPDTVKRRRYILEAFLAHIGGATAAKAVKRRHVEDWLYSQEVAASTLRKHYNVLRAFFRFVFERGWAPASPTLGIVLPRIPRKQPRALTLEELRALALALPDERARLIIALALNEGLRRVEIARLELSDVDTLAMTLRVLTAKSDTEDTIPLTEWTLQFLRPYMAVRGNVPGPLIQSQRRHGGITADAIGNMVSQWMKDAGIKTGAFDGKSLHACRHTFAINLLDHGADLATIQLGLRHASPSSSNTYLRLRQDVERLRPFMGQHLKEMA